nr:hypothetical protein [Chloroflexota bacterium]
MILNNQSTDTNSNDHKTTELDPFEWLEESTPKTDRWIEEWCRESEQYFSSLEGRENLKDRLETIFHIDAVGIPTKKGKNYFYMRRKSDEDLFVLYRKTALNGEGEILIDPNQLSSDHSTTLSNWFPSKNGLLLAYSLSEAGNDRNSIQLLDVTTCEHLDDLIPADLYPQSVTWSKDDSGFWYVRRKEGAPEEECKFHKKLY